MKNLDVNIKKQLKNFEMDMSFKIEEGCTGILGASGCGKSMTLKAIAGIVTPDQGIIKTEKHIFYDSDKKINLPPQKRRVGYLFQNYALFPNMTVAENIAAGVIGGSTGRKPKKAEINRQVEELMEQFHLEELKNQYAVKLSGGQQQRTALARILASKPDILLLDEPFSAMDSYLKEELQIELHNRLKEFQGCTVIVSHDRDEIYKLCSRTMIVDEGKKIICEDTTSLFEDPEHMVAARLTGCKNLSKAVKISEHKVRALDWGIDFTIEREIPEDISYVGVRAHDFVPAGENEPLDKNVINVLVSDTTLSPFEHTIIFKNKDNPQKAIWMKGRKQDTQIPQRVRVDDRKILLLKDH